MGKNGEASETEVWCLSFRLKSETKLSEQVENETDELVPETGA